MNTKEHQELECRKAVLFEYVIHRFGCCDEMALTPISSRNKLQVRKSYLGVNTVHFPGKR